LGLSRGAIDLQSFVLVPTSPATRRTRRGRRWRHGARFPTTSSGPKRRTRLKTRSTRKSVLARSHSRRPSTSSQPTGSSITVITCWS